MSVLELKRALYEALKAAPKIPMSVEDFELFCALENEFEV